MKRTIEISDDIADLIQQYLQKNPSHTLSSLIQEALVQKIVSEQSDEHSTAKEVALPDSQQIEKFIALSGIVQHSLRHSDEHAEDYVD